MDAYNIAVPAKTAFIFLEIKVIFCIQNEKRHPVMYIKASAVILTWGSLPNTGLSNNNSNNHPESRERLYTPDIEMTPWKESKVFVNSREINKHSHADRPYRDYIFILMSELKK